MTDKRPQTIQFFLPQGEPRGIRIADITTRIVQAVLVPRSKLSEAAKRRVAAILVAVNLSVPVDRALEPACFIVGSLGYGAPAAPVIRPPHLVS